MTKATSKPIGIGVVGAGVISEIYMKNFAETFPGANGTAWDAARWAVNTGTTASAPFSGSNAAINWSISAASTCGC